MEFSVFLFVETDKLILSDIDGTITEGDIKGHISTFLGITSVQENVVELFDKVDKNGYKVVYLTARLVVFVKNYVYENFLRRSMAQEEDTRDYLFKMLQNVNGFSMPRGDKEQNKLLRVKCVK